MVHHLMNIFIPPLVAVQGYDCHYGECPGGNLEETQDSVRLCAAGCTRPNCMGLLVERRNNGTGHCIRKGHTCKYKESLANIQDSSKDQYMCYAGKASD